MAKLVNMRGLQVQYELFNLKVLLLSICRSGNCTVSNEQVFIADIRNCQNKEQEKSRVDKELGKIRKKFASGSAITGGHP